ncbi:MAG: hypothetical protein A2V77_18425 [Anaeromyxobacter sp. RBG_16_69_14]|nr:MAG: hypothetical protein A2V77_18425 [Anaeromyxobacter sp. RBG_16_69_14]
MSRPLKSYLLPLLLSVGLIVPCFWRPIVSTADFQSHLYNAWLAQLIDSGRAPGLWIGAQWTNVATDLLLDFFVKRWGIAAAERAVASIAVLVFFWGAFTFISVVARTSSRRLAPWLAIISYGYVFQLGLLNFYLSSGLVFWLLAITWDDGLKRFVVAAALLLLALLAHPIPPLWFAAVMAYREAARRMRPPLQGVLFLAGVIVLYVIRRYVIASNYQHDWDYGQLLSVTGADQTLLYGWRYLPAAFAFLLFLAWFAVERGFDGLRRDWSGILAQLFGLTAVAVVLIPSSFRVSPHGPWVGLFAERLSLYSVLLLLAFLASQGVRKRHLVVGLLTAAYFFGVLYVDLGKAARIEEKMEALVGTLAPNQRVVAYVNDLGTDRAQPTELDQVRQTFERWARHIPWINGILGYSRARISLRHLVGRACIGHCFNFMNYEPASGQFRIHVSPGSPLVTSRIADAYSLEAGRYVVQDSDPPLHAIYRCGPRTVDLCIRQLAPGQSALSQSALSTTEIEGEPANVASAWSGADRELKEGAGTSQCDAAIGYGGDDGAGGVAVGGDGDARGALRSRCTVYRASE